tara:strand:- start:504 stop:1244 length:741 start_codon:yes stop_codon:yes gene_type:complete
MNEISPNAIKAGLICSRCNTYTEKAQNLLTKITATCNCLNHLGNNQKNTKACWDCGEWSHSCKCNTTESNTSNTEPIAGDNNPYFLPGDKVIGSITEWEKTVYKTGVFTKGEPCLHGENKEDCSGCKNKNYGEQWIIFDSEPKDSRFPTWDMARNLTLVAKFQPGDRVRHIPYGSVIHIPYGQVISIIYKTGVFQEGTPCPHNKPKKECTRCFNEKLGTQWIIFDTSEKDTQYPVWNTSDNYELVS